MDTPEIAVVFSGIAVIAALAWYFFAPRKAVGAQLEGGRQVIDITVGGGCSPKLVTVEAGKPVRHVGPRLDAGPGRERADFALPGALRSLPADVAGAEAQPQAVDGVESAPSPVAPTPTTLRPPTAGPRSRT